MMDRMTSLGLNERLERVLAYAFGWLSGIILFFLEKIAMCVGMLCSRWLLLERCQFLYWRFPC